jgi:hypothetical protein
MVSGTDPVCTILVFTEDSSKTALTTLAALTKKLLRHIDSYCETHRIRFEPANDEAREILTANQFKNPGHGRRFQLYRYIATQLTIENRFIVHHVDADRTWSTRGTAPSENAAAIQRNILAHVHRVLAERFSAEEIERRLVRFLRLVPYWELESWLYQNTERANDLGPHRPDCRCAELLAAWRADRALLDEQPHPSDTLCIGKQHNDELVQGFPTAEVYAAGKSLAAAVDAMLECEPLLHAIQRTYAPSTPAPDPA